MNEEFAKNLLKKVQDDYNKMADRFSSRKKLWPELYCFDCYVKEGDKILDLGCGSGRLVELFKDKKIDYQGIDISESLIEIARKKYPGYKFMVADMMSLPFRENEFEVVFSIASLHHIPSGHWRQQVVAESLRVLKPNGLFILLVRNLYQPKFFKYFIYYTIKKLLGENLDFKDVFIPWLYGGADRYFHAFTKRELKKLVKNSRPPELSSGKSPARFESRPVRPRIAEGKPGGSESGGGADNFKILDSYYAKDDKESNIIQGDNLVLVAQK